MSEVISSPSQEELWAGVEARRQRLLTPIPFDIEHRGGQMCIRDSNSRRRVVNTGCFDTTY